MFKNEVIEKLGNYVYRLIDPRDGLTFYVGKGKGNRVFDHARARLKEDNSFENSLKLNRIAEINEAGLNVEYIIHRHQISEAAIFEVEAALIDAYSGLTNSQRGHGSGQYGPMKVEEILATYALPAFDQMPVEKLVIININQIGNRNSTEAIYEQVRGHWKLSIERANSADYVLAVCKGVILGIFERTGSWYKSPNFTDRYCFDGKPASTELWEKYVGDYGKRIEVDEMKHVQNPIRYVNIPN